RDWSSDVCSSDLVNQNIYRLIINLIGKVSRGDPAGIAAQPVVGMLIRQQRVKNKGKAMAQLFKSFRKCAMGPFAQLAVRVVQLAQSLLLRQLFAIQGKAGRS